MEQGIETYITEDGKSLLVGLWEGEAYQVYIYTGAKNLNLIQKAIVVGGARNFSNRDVWYPLMRMEESGLGTA